MERIVPLTLVTAKNCEVETHESSPGLLASVNKSKPSPRVQLSGPQKVALRLSREAFKIAEFVLS